MQLFEACNVTAASVAPCARWTLNAYPTARLILGRGKIADFVRNGFEEKQENILNRQDAKDAKKERREDRKGFVEHLYE